MQMKDVNIEDLNYDDLEAVAHLKGSTRYEDIMQVSPASIPQCLQPKACLCTVLHRLFLGPDPILLFM